MKLEEVHFNHDVNSVSSDALNIRVNAGEPDRPARRWWKPSSSSRAARRTVAGSRSESNNSSGPNKLHQEEQCHQLKSSSTFLAAVRTRSSRWRASRRARSWTG